MFFLNLTIGEFIGLLSALSGLVTALYLLDRAKRKKIVSTLRFWTPALTSQEQQTRKRMREPWSLLLQLLSLVLLLLAIAQLEWGSRERRGRDHVLLLDTSAWTAEAQGNSTLLGREKIVAEQFLKHLRPRDRVMLVRADALAVPVTAFTADRAKVLTAIRESVPGYTALNLDQALSFSSQAQTWSGGVAGETVYIGPSMVADGAGPKVLPANLRILPVEATLADCGIERVSVRRSDEDASTWQATIRVRNYGDQPALVRLNVQFAGTPFAPRSLQLAPFAERSTEYSFVTNTAGQLITSIDVSGRAGDALPSDNRAVLELPRAGSLTLAVYSSRPEVLRPLLEANHRLTVRFFPPSAYSPHPAADVMLIDSVPVTQPPRLPSLWIVTDRIHSPVPVKETAHDAAITEWQSGSSLGAGLHAKDTVPNPQVFQLFQGDLAVASIPAGPVVVARPAGQNQAKLAVIGFDPLAGEMKFSVTTPLLVANLLHWIAPDSFQTVEVAAGQVGSASVSLEPQEQGDKIEARDDRGFTVPASYRQQTLQLFVTRPGIIRVNSEDRQRILSLTLPDIAAQKWSPPRDAKSGVPPGSEFAPSAIDLWHWLAILAAALLFAEWLLFGSRRFANRRPAAKNAPAVMPARDGQRELVGK